jgi:hypothetical protein
VNGIANAAGGSRQRSTRASLRMKRARRTAGMNAQRMTARCCRSRGASSPWDCHPTYDDAAFASPPSQNDFAASRASAFSLQPWIGLETGCLWQRIASPWRWSPRRRTFARCFWPLLVAGAGWPRSRRKSKACRTRTRLPRPLSVRLIARGVSATLTRAMRGVSIVSLDRRNYRKIPLGCTPWVRQQNCGQRGLSPRAGGSPQEPVRRVAVSFSGCAAWLPAAMCKVRQ